MLAFPENFEDMKQFCPDFKINLVHAWNVNPADFKTGLRKVFELLPYAASKKKLRAYIQEHEEAFDHLTGDDCDALEVFIGMDRLGITEREKFKNQEGGSYNMCTALREIREEGREEGIGAFVELCQEFGKTFEETAKKLAEKFNLNEESIRENMEKFWKA